MEHSVKIVAYSQDIENKQVTDDKISMDLMLLCGKAAGICYMPDNYIESDTGYNNVENAIKRAKSTAKRGHHSIFDHATISYIIRTSKMMAIVLNSLGVYTTSEKSARYTAMKANTQEEQIKYDKWKAKLQGIIVNKIPSIDDDYIKVKLIKALKEDRQAIELGFTSDSIDVKSGCAIYGIEYAKLSPLINDKISVIKESENLPSYKLAQENARYMLSVFTPTVLQYSMSYRQTALVTEYLKNFWLSNKDNSCKFYRTVAEEAYELSNQFKKLFKEFPVHDIKNQSIRLMPDTENKGYYDKQDYIGDTYTVNYLVSFAALAQAVRHRTIRHSFIFQDTKLDEMKYYVPEIVKDAGLTDEWLSDIKQLEEFTPQGTLVLCTEQGVIEDFALKCKERCCSRAQLEIARVTKDVLEKMGSAVYKNQVSMCEYNKDLIKSMISYNAITCEVNAKPRCCFGDFKCTDTCTFGAKQCFTRLV